LGGGGGGGGYGILWFVRRSRHGAPLSRGVYRSFCSLKTRAN